MYYNYIYIHNSEPVCVNMHIYMSIWKIKVSISLFTMEIRSPKRLSRSRLRSCDSRRRIGERGGAPFVASGYD